jgi:hypothetical protein
MLYHADHHFEIVETFWRDGIVILEQFYEPRIMTELALAFEQLVNSDPSRPFGGGPDYARLRETRVRVWPGKDVPLCEQVMTDSRLDVITKSICGDDMLRLGISIFSTPRGCGQAWHQDSSGHRPEHFELNRIVFPSNVAAEQGELHFVPGSHTGPDLPPGGNYDPLPGERSVAPKAGTLVLMHTRCFHRVGINQTDKPRTQCNSRTRPAGAPDGLTGLPVFRTGKWNFVTGKPE